MAGGFVGAGLTSVALTGDGKDMLEIIGLGMDPVCLVRCMRKKVGHAQILKVEEVKDKESQPVVVNTEEARPADKPANRRRRARSTGGFRAILTKLSKFMWPRARRSVSPPPPSPLRVEHTDNPAPAASGGPSSHLFSVPSTSTAFSAASPPACTQEQLARNPSAFAQRQDLSRAADLPPVRVAQARRRRRTFNIMSSRTTTQQAQGNVSSSNARGTDDELAAVEAGCVLEDYVAMFDGPMPPAVIAALAGAVFHLDDEDGIPMGNA
uniref:Uncharacterized protein n=1 Tax=Setaria italica TaxID=4555 RepID=K3ZM86_SETIT